MATVRLFSVMMLFAVFYVQYCICADTPESFPSPAPESGGDLTSPPPTAATPESPVPGPAPLANVDSPPAPPHVDISPDSSPSPSPTDGSSEESPAPTPDAAVASDISQEITVAVKDLSPSGGGMNGGKKVGVAFGVIAAACVVGFGALVYKKRRQNIQRAQFGYAARRDFL